MNSDIVYILIHCWTFLISPLWYMHLNNFLVFFFFYLLNLKDPLGSLDIRIVLDKCAMAWIFSHRDQSEFLSPVCFFNMVGPQKCEHLHLTKQKTNHPPPEYQNIIKKWKRPGTVMTEDRRKEKGGRSESRRNGTKENIMYRFCRQAVDPA